MVAAAAELRASLRALFGASEIYSLWPVAGIPDVRPVEELARVSPTAPANDVLVVHVAEVTPEVNELLLARPERVVTIYHGTPAWEPYLLFDPDGAGRYLATPTHLGVLAERSDIAIASAPHNAAILEQAGFRNVVSTPVRLDLDALESVAPHEPTVNHFRSGGPMVLYAGPIDPHHHVERLVQAFHVLTTYHDPTARLVIAGTAAVPRYVTHLAREIDELNLLGAWLALDPSAELLATFYQQAGAFVSPGVPSDVPSSLLSALQLGVPAIACDVPVVRDAVGGAVMLLPVEAGPLVLAEAILEVFPGGRSREELIRQGRERVAPFDAEVATAEWFSLVLDAGR